MNGCTKRTQDIVCTFWVDWIPRSRAALIVFEGLSALAMAMAPNVIKVASRSEREEFGRKKQYLSGLTPPPAAHIPKLLKYSV